MKILMVARSNLDELGGGDRIQILNTKATLERRGHSVALSTRFVADLSGYDVVHLFNIQANPYSLLVYLGRAQRQGTPVALSTIYWNPDEWLAHKPRRLAARRRWSDTFYPFRGIPFLRVVQAFLDRPAAFNWLWLYLKHPGGRRAAEVVKRHLVAGVDIILPNGETEGEMVQRDLGRAKACHVVPNGVSDVFQKADPQRFRANYLDGDFVLSVGRIETRKNALALARAATDLNLPLVMIGNDQVEPEYVRRIRQISPEAIIIPEMPHDELGSGYHAAKVHALASWFETPGLSSLEAAVCNCNIVTTDRGTAREYFGDLAWYCDPADDASIRTALQQAFAAPRSDKLRRHVLTNFSWDRVGEATERAYRHIAAPDA